MQMKRPFFRLSAGKRGNMYDIKESGARIKELRLKRGVTQEQMANDLGVTVETISRIERGVRGASIDLISILSGYFNTTIDFLVDGKAVEECNNLLQGLDETKRAKVIAMEYGWDVAVYSSIEHIYGYDYVTSCYKDNPLDSWKQLVDYMHEIYPEATDKQIRKILK